MTPSKKSLHSPTLLKTLVAAAALWAVSGAAMADITVGVTLSLT